MRQGEVEITLAMIDEVVDKLPVRYIDRLAEICYGDEAEGKSNRIKYWRSGRMKDPVESQKLYAAAKVYLKECEKEIAKVSKL